MRPTLVAVSRWLVGVLLLVSGAQKALAPAVFLSSLQAYPLTAHLPSTALAGLLPWIELFLGFCLVTGLAPRGSALWSALLLLTYSVALIQRAIVSPHEGAWFLQTLDCGCGFGAVQVGLKLLENALFIGLSVACARAPRDRFVVASIE